jgi:hypothetical protein
MFMAVEDRHIRSSQKCRYSPVIILSTSIIIYGTARRQCGWGANEYFTKPSNYDSFMKLGDLIRKFLPNGWKTH